jgi:hypothetical protein
VTDYDLMLYGGIAVVLAAAIALDRWFAKVRALHRVRIAAAIVSAALILIALVVRMTPLSVSSQAALVAAGLVWGFMVYAPARFGRGVVRLVRPRDIPAP